jgi:hypothetical protein
MADIPGRDRNGSRPDPLESHGIVIRRQITDNHRRWNRQILKRPFEQCGFSCAGGREQIQRQDARMVKAIAIIRCKPIVFRQDRRRKLERFTSQFGDIRLMGMVMRLMMRVIMMRVIMGVMTVRMMLVIVIMVMLMIVIVIIMIVIMVMLVIMLTMS